MRKVAFLAVLLVVAATATSAGTVHALGQTEIAKITTSSKLVSKKPVTKTMEKPAVEAAAAPITPAASTPVVVTVQAGDSLTKIATANGTTYVRLFNANESIATPDVIHVGQQIRIPAPEEVLPERVAAQPVVTAATTTTTRRVAAKVVAAPLPNDEAKAFIYSRESGNNPNATNPSGCYGLGQDCNGVVRARCGADYACQDQYFTDYMLRRYGSWSNAVAFWQLHHWW